MVHSYSANEDKRNRSYDNVLGRPRIIQLWIVTLVFNLIFIIIVCIMLSNIYRKRKDCVCDFF